MKRKSVRPDHSVSSDQVTHKNEIKMLICVFIIATNKTMKSSINADIQQQQLKTEKRYNNQQRNH